VVGIFTAASIPLWAAGISAAGGIASGLMGQGQQQGTQYASQQSQLPGWMSNAAMQNYGMATNDYYNYMPPYSGERVAPLTAGQQSGINALWQNINSTQPAFQQASNITSGLTGFQVPQINPQSLASTSLTPYMSPYTQSVIDPSMKLLQQQNQLSLNQIGDQAAQNRAFGGSRQGVAEGVQNAQTNLLAGQLGANLWNQNFNQAQAAATGDITRNMQGQVYNASNALQGAQFQGNMANQLASLATGGQNAWLTGMNAAMGGQNMLQQQQQLQDQAAQQAYAEQQAWPQQRLAILQNALAQSPYGQTNMSSGPGPYGSPLMTGLGTGATLAGLFGKYGAFGTGSNGPTGYYPTSSGSYFPASTQNMGYWQQAGL
jgi:hypothetical protein